MKKALEKKIAERISGLAYNTTKNSVGKSVPLLVHEVKMPDSVKKEFLEKKNEAR